MTPRFIGLKRTLASVLQSWPIGKAIGALYGDVIPFHGLPIDVRGTGIRVANKASLLWGMYESAEYRFVRLFLQTDLPVIELGSSIGAVSSAIARHLDPGQRLMCVEANPALIPALQRNLRRNASHLRVGVVHAAIAYDAETINFHVSADTLVSRIGGGGHGDDPVVPATTLTALYEGFGKMPYQLVADIEGSELDILSRDVGALRSCQAMILELHESCRDGVTYTKDHLRQLAREAGFQVVSEYGAVVACRRNSPLKDCHGTQSD
jgi:FkbM family methyltransferase